MERYIDLDEITDGKKYGMNDLVKVGCNDCAGCSACCRDMGTSIQLDPFDVYRMTTGLNTTFEAMLNQQIEINVIDGLILPNLKMNDATKACSFLNSEGRCNVHTIRPGICRIFPLGRVYEDHSFSYVLQTHECKKDNKTKVKLQKWIDTPDTKKNEEFIIRWHYFVKEQQSFIKNCKNDESIKNLNLVVLNFFYLKPYTTTVDFYTQFEDRMNQAEKYVASLQKTTEE